MLAVERETGIEPATLCLEGRWVAPPAIPSGEHAKKLFDNFRKLSDNSLRLQSEILRFKRAARYDRFVVRYEI